MTILEYIRQHIKSINVKGKEANGLCPFHDDTKMSFSMNIDTGRWNCFAKCGGGTLVRFVEQAEKLSNTDSKKFIRLKKIELNGGVGAPGDSPEGRPSEPSSAPVVQSIEVAKRSADLLLSEDILEKLRDTRGITADTCEKFALGWDGDRLWIPILSGNDVVNVRKYDLLKRHGGEYKVISYKAGYGKTRVYPIENLKHDPILLVEGEMDCLLANQLGFNAVTVTGGAGTFPKEFINAFKGKTVNICYDNDEAGKAGATKAARILDKTASPRIITLPVEGRGEDFTDYIIKYGNTREDFAELLKVPSKPEENAKAPKIVSLADATDAKHLNKEVIVNAMVSGKDLQPYLVPKKIRITCEMGQKKCSYCPVKEAEGDLSFQIPYNDPDLLSLIDCPKAQQHNVLKQRMKILGCNSCEVKIDSVYNIEEARLIPEIDFSVDGREYVARRIYSLGEPIHANRAYCMTGIVMPHPKSQYATHIIYKKQPIQDSIENFKLTKEDIAALKIFQPASIDKIEEKIGEITRDLTYNVTHIYKREDIITAIDLVYHSPIKIKFLNKEITRGWCECLIIGDTRTGKSETMKMLLIHYHAGEIVTGENTSYAGLVGGMQQSHDKWTISWGKIPLNDRRLVAIDEVSGMPVEQLSNMSGIRSSGVAEIVKIQTERTHARTRMIWMSNTRFGRPLDSYNYGVGAIKELIGRLEDVARFDFAVSCATSEVDQKEIHLHKQPHVEHRFTKALCNKLIMWAWSRESRHVHFTVAAEKLILEQAQIMGREYSADIPLVEPSEQRIKLARLSAALAIRLFSTTDGENVTVEKEHVDFIVKYLLKCYTKASMGYDMFSKAQGHASMDEETYERLKREYIAMPSWEELRTLLLDYQIFRKIDLMDQIGYMKEDATVLFKWIGKNRLAKSSTVGYHKSPAFTIFLKRLGDDPTIERIEEKEERF